MTHANAADLEAIRLEYRASLADLTFNSKPIITNLTIIAQENLGAAPAIVRAIEDQLRNAQPKQKLPVLYLLDSILKNVGNIYISLFERNIVRMFATAFEVIDSDEKQRFIKVLLTWKNHPAGPLFSAGTIAALENVVAKMGRVVPARRPSLGPIHVNPNFVALAQSVSPQSSTPPPSAIFPGLGNQQKGVHRGATDRVPQRSPYDRPRGSRGRPDSSRRMNGNIHRNADSAHVAARDSFTPPLYPDHPAGRNANGPGFQNPRQRSPSSVDVSALQHQIKTVLAQKEALALMNPMDSSAVGHVQVLTQLLQAVQTTALDAASIAQIGQMLQQYAASVHLPPIPAAQPPVPVLSLLPTVASLAQSFNFGLAPGPSVPPSFSTSGFMTTPGLIPTGAQSFLSNPDALKGLLGSLDSQTNMMAGISSSFGITGGHGNINAGPQSTPVPDSTTGGNVQSIKDLPLIRLVHEDLNRTYPMAVRLLYEALDLQCRQCGTRYPRNETGRAKMDLHLDWHFRQNRRAKEKAKKAISRDWFVNEDEWVAEREVDIRDRKAPMLFFDRDTPEAAGPVEIVSNIPAAGEANPRCAVCTEELEKFYDEETDDWMLRGAVRVDNTVSYIANGLAINAFLLMVSVPFSTS
ncbi:hypothetical protein DFJ77DRAFT_295563 [Powellomyces hirtus]|nr:hypothetical protein DFJ77DRAFT_295563 [Powellomyces hirtus]